MSLTAVVDKEFHDTVRSRKLHAVVGAFCLFAVWLAAIQWVPTIYRDSAVATSTLALLNSLRQPTVVFVPLVGLALGHTALVDERDGGTLRLLVGLPNTRAEVVLGKFLARGAVLAVGVVVTYALVGVVAAATYSAVALRPVVTYALLTLLLGLAYVGIGIGVSAATESRTLALATAGGLYGVFMLGWDAVLLVLQLATVGSELPPGGLPDWIEFVGVWNPSTAFSYAANATVPAHDELTTFPESDAVFLQDWVGLPILLVWIVLPLAVGYWRFERVDL